MSLPSNSALIAQCHAVAMRHNSYASPNRAEVFESNSHTATVVFSTPIGDTVACKWRMGVVTYLG